ncbi:hypothetical protein J0H58_29460 [bacterium]|nr:hypothetical protein [bacterium]
MCSPPPRRVAVQSVRAGWYGGEWSLMEEQGQDFWAEWVPFPPGFPAPAWTGGAGLFF